MLIYFFVNLSSNFVNQEQLDPLKRFLRLQGKLTETLTKLYDGLVDNLRTTLKLVLSRKGTCKNHFSEPSMGGIVTIFNKNLACVTSNKFLKSVKQLLHL